MAFRRLRSRALDSEDIRAGPACTVSTICHVSACSPASIELSINELKYLDLRSPPAGPGQRELAPARIAVRCTDHPELRTTVGHREDRDLDNIRRISRSGHDQRSSHGATGILERERPDRIGIAGYAVSTPGRHLPNVRFCACPRRWASRPLFFVSIELPSMTRRPVTYPLSSTAPLPSVARSVPLTFRTHIAFV
jgi:hypothetical protein